MVGLNKKNIVITVAVATSMLFSGCGGSSSNNDSSSSGESSAQVESQKQQAEQKLQEQKAATKEIRAILSNTPSKADEVEQKTIYQSWGADKYPAKTAFYWAVTVKGNTISDVSCLIVQFTSDTNWIFWDKLIFSDGAGNNWVKELNTFVGQSGGGKKTQVVMGGKYETWSGSLKEVKEGYELLANSNNPILRVTGAEYKTDIKPSIEDVNQIRTALRMNELIGKLDKGKLID